jgi:hypothetical protein
VTDTSTLRTRILGAFILALGIVIVGGGIGAYGLLNALDQYRTQVANLSADQAAVLRIESHFKIQVQEWKNVLLRGKDSAALEKYWHGFEKEETAVTSEGARLLTALPEGKAKALVGNFLAAHKQLGEGYRKGLAAFKEAAGDSAVGDKAVAGIDRAPTQTLDRAVEEIVVSASAARTTADAQAQHSTARSPLRLPSCWPSSAVWSCLRY